MTFIRVVLCVRVYFHPDKNRTTMRVLIPTDFSDNAMHAATYAVQLFGKSEATFTLLLAQYDAGYAGAIGYSMGPELLKSSEEGLAREANRFVESTGAASVETHLAFGFLSTVVNDHVNERGADAVVMGRRGKTGSALFGSNTVDLLKRSPVPVVAVPEMARLRPLHRIVLASDHGEVLLASLALLRTIALRHRSEVLVTHVEMEVPANTENWSKGLYEVALRDVPLTFVEGYGHNVADGLERTAKIRKADMIAILHRHLDLFDRLFHPSVAKELTMGSDMPLLVMQQDV